MADSNWGGPGLIASQLTLIKNVGGLPLRVRKEVAPIFQYLINELQKPGYRKPGAVALSSSGGYNKRYIKNTTKWSNHSWGLAVDLNAPTNPYSYTLTTDFVVEKVRPLCDYLGLRWGYFYTGKKDPMHFEFIGSPTEAAAIVAKLNKPSNTILQPLKLVEKRVIIDQMLSLGTVLEPGNQIVSRNKRHRFVMQGDGNAVVYTDNRPVWSLLTLSGGAYATRIEFTKDGRIAAYNNTTLVWATDAPKNVIVYGGQVVMQDDGNLVLQIKAVKWSTKTQI